MLEYIVRPLEVETGEDEIRGDFKSALQEWTQRRNGVVPEYRLIEETGPDHAKTFRVEVDAPGIAAFKYAPLPGK